MKKFTFLLSLLLAFVGVTASAQVTMKKMTVAPDLTKAVTNLDELKDGGTYVFYNINNQKYINIDNFDNFHFGRAAELSVDQKIQPQLYSHSTLPKVNLQLIPLKRL